MKKNLLFVIDSLDCAGAEKSLVTLLTTLDYSKYNVDLMLFAHGHQLEELVPKEVNVLKPLKYTSFSKLPLRKALKYSVLNRKYEMLASRIKYSTAIRIKRYSNPQKARVFWKSVTGVIERNPKTYDIAISYAQGVPTFYVAEKVTAAKKFAWVNVSYRLEKKESEFHKRFYNQYNQIVAVSDSTKKVFLQTFPEYLHKVNVIYDINNPNFISDMAGIGDGFEDDFNGIRILTIGRLAHQKGYDTAIEACRLLKNSDLDFRWYVLGKGPLREELIEKIKQHNLTEHLILLGVKANPYTHIKNADMYVQTSRFEGFGLAIAEARMLNIPIVTTRFDAVYNQMVHEKNGLVVDMNGDAVFKGIQRLIRDKELKQRIIHNLSREQKGNVDEIEKFYQLIG